MIKFILSFIFLFSVPAYPNYNSGVLKNYIQEIQLELAHELENEFGLDYTCGYAYPHDAAMDFSIYTRVTLKEARHLIVFITEKLIEKINTDKRIRPFLGTSISSPYDISVGISCYNPINMLQCDGSISLVHLANSKIFYSTYDAFESHFCDIHEESYDEAKHIVALTLPKMPSLHKDSAIESGFDTTINSYTREAANKLRLAVVNLGCKKGNRLERVDIRMTRYKKTKEKQARALIVKAVEKLLAMINSNEALSPHGNTSFSADQIRMRINFRNNNCCSFDKNSLESVVLEDGKVTYFEKKHSERIPILSESYLEAKGRVF